MTSGVAENQPSWSSCTPWSKREKRLYRWSQYLCRCGGRRIAARRLGAAPSAGACLATRRPPRACLRVV
jgi:hypothetical protein